MRVRAWVGGLILGLGMYFLTAPAAQALITNKMPLGSFLADSIYIVSAKIDKFEPDKQRMVLVVDEHLKGKSPFTRLPVVLQGDAEATKGKQVPLLLKRLAGGLPLVLFLLKNDDNYLAFTYTNGTWFLMFGVKPEKGDSLVWSFAHLEPYLRRTFKGTTAELKQTVAEVLQGKRKPPPSNDKEKPGLGPEVVPEKKQGAATPIHQGPVFAVVPTVLVGGPLAVLSMLFPTLFGGWKRWLAFISVVCTTSTIFMLYWWFEESLMGTFWATPLVLWLALTAVTFLGSVWAWVRFVRQVAGSQAPAGTDPAGAASNSPQLVPSKTELGILVCLSLVGLGVLGYARLGGANLFKEVAWLQVLVVGIGAWSATLYALVVRWKKQRTRPALATEVVLLSAMVLASTLLAGTQKSTAGLAPSGSVSANLQDDDPVQKGKVVWTSKISARVQGLWSMPLVAGDRVYVSVGHDNVYAPNAFGAVHCLDSKTGKTIWMSRGSKDKKLKMICLSSPCLADGRLYIGEGFHQDSGCRMTCLDAQTGKWLWEFKTESHVESSPVVVAGRVYFGAGDDGVYCIDARTGQRLWQAASLHVDSTPLVRNGRVYAGSGMGDKVQKMAAVCLNADNGERIWERPLKHPAWGSPTMAGKLVYFGIGTGRLETDGASSEGGAGRPLGRDR